MELVTASRPAIGLLAVAAVLAACAPATSPGPVFLLAPDSAARMFPFSEAVEANGFLFLSGMIGNAHGTVELAPGGIEAEAVQVMENVKAALERHGSSLDRVVKCTVFLADMRDWPAFNAVYRRYFAPGRFPARSALGANGLVFNARVELECIASR